MFFQLHFFCGGTRASCTPRAPQTSLSSRFDHPSTGELEASEVSGIYRAAQGKTHLTCRLPSRHLSHEVDSRLSVSDCRSSVMMSARFS